MRKIGWVSAGLVVVALSGAIAVFHITSHTPNLALTVATALAKGAVIGIAKLIQLVV